MEKIIYYSILKNGSVDITVNINGKDKGNYNYCSYKQLRNEFKGKGFKFVKC